MITIRFNDTVTHITNNKSLSELLIEKGYHHDYLAVALNNEFVPRTEHASIIIKEHDAIEIITPMQGG